MTDYVWTDWVQPPDETRTLAAWTGDPYTVQVIPERSASTAPVVPPPAASPSNGVLADAVFLAYDAAASEARSAPTSDAPLLSTGLRVSTIANRYGLGTGPDSISQWTYQAGGVLEYRQFAARIALPDLAGYSPPLSAWPAGATEVEVASTPPTILATSIGYVFEEFSRDESGPGDAAEDALGSWTYALSSGSDSVTITGPQPYGTQITGTIAATAEPAADGTYSTPVTADLTLGSVQARDPGFGIENGAGGGYYHIGEARWTPTVTATFRPPLVRYKIPADTTTPMPVCRLTQRKDGRGPLGGPKRMHHPPDSRQGGFRPGGVY